MGVVYFDEEHKHDRETSSRKVGFLDISGWLVRKGLAANQTSADLALVVIFALVLGLTFFIVQHGSNAGQAVSGQVLNQTMTRGTPPGH